MFLCTQAQSHNKYVNDSDPSNNTQKTTNAVQRIMISTDNNCDIL